MSKRIIKFASIVFLSTATLSAHAESIKTLDQAQALCPKLEQLHFSTTGGPVSTGTITGTSHSNNRTPNPAPHPSNLTVYNFIIGAQFRLENNKYGFIAADMVTCYYSYTDTNGTPVNLAMSGDN